MSDLPWAELTVGVSAVAGLVLTVQQFVKFLGNHMSHVSRAMEESAKSAADAATAMRLMTDAMRDLKEEIRSQVYVVAPVRARRSSGGARASRRR